MYRRPDQLAMLSYGQMRSGEPVERTAERSCVGDRSYSTSVASVSADWTPDCEPFAPRGQGCPELCLARLDSRSIRLSNSSYMTHILYMHVREPSGLDGLRARSFPLGHAVTGYHNSPPAIPGAARRIWTPICTIRASGTQKTPTLHSSRAFKPGIARLTNNAGAEAFSMARTGVSNRGTPGAIAYRLLIHICPSALRTTGKTLQRAGIDSKEEG